MAAAYDIERDPKTMAILSPVGFVNAVHLATKIKHPLAMPLLAPEWSSWAPINMGASGRPTLNPLGNRKFKYVRSANIMVSRVVLLLWLFVALGVFAAVEQPVNSLMQRRPRMKHCIISNKIYRVRIHMGDFGATSTKGNVALQPVSMDRRHQPVHSATQRHVVEPGSVQ